MKVRPLPLALLCLFVLAPSCTGGSATPTPGASRSPGSPAPPSAGASASPVGPNAIPLDVVAATFESTGSAEAADDRSYLDGMRFAVQQIDAAGGLEGRPLELRFHDDAGDPSRAAALVESLLTLRRRPAAILYVGPGSGVAGLRESFAMAGTPLIVLQGDLYTSHQLFPEAFQTSIPWTWQAKVIARYLVKDRKAKRIVFVGSGPEADAAARATGEWLRYWGGDLAGSFVQGGSNRSPPPFPASKADAVVAFGSTADVHGVAATMRTASSPPRVVAGSALLPPAAGFDPPAPGTTACYTYTWAGWAQAIPRVGAFIRAFAAAFGHPPEGFEQEGYDAVEALALGLRRDGLRGGRALVASLESIKETAFSSFPIDLGPDDHLFLPRDELGLFAVPGPRERLDPWQSRAETNLWRPVMRTFTYDGQRDDILDQDKRVFFPFWRKDQPGPKYWRSRYGIKTTPDDPLH